MRRSISILGLLIGFTLLWPVRAAVAGGASFELDDEYYAPGEVVQGSTSVWMGRGAMGLLDEGPYVAYLTPSDKWIDPPHVPASSVPVGTVEFSVMGEEEAIATVSFVVPDVPSATYGISYCNDPCKVASVGDLVGGWISVAEDEEQAALVARVSRLEMRNGMKAFTLKELRREGKALERRRHVATETVAELRATVGEFEARLQAMPKDTSDGVSVWSLIGVAGTGMGAGLLIGRRRRGSSEQPSPVEEAERVLESGPPVTIKQIR